MQFVLPFYRVWSRRLGLVVALGLAVAASAMAQAPELRCLMLPVEPASRAQQSALVVEAQVLDAQGFWDGDHRRLFTRHRLRVFSLLKGQVSDTTGLVLVTEGGRLGLDQQILTNTLRLAAGQQGVFFLTPAPWSGLPTASRRAWTPFGSEQGFIEYNPTERTANEPFRTYPAINAAFYQEIARHTGQARQVLQANPALAVHAPTVRRGLAPTIVSFSPQRLPAGTGAVLTINGDGFGATRGTGFVEFRNADDGGVTRVKAREADYVSWTDTRIEVRVPSSANGGSPVSNGRPAGSGPIRVTTAGQLNVETSNSLTVIYALTNVENTDGNILQRPNHIAKNASGGITFRPGPNFGANPTAGLQRALTSWRCQTGMNWEIGTANANNTIADDGLNVIAFDAGAELPNLVLGRTTSYYQGCYAPGGAVVFWVKEIDMQFDDAAVFQFGPAPAIGALGQIDFETVAVHELGHAQQLGHLNLPGAVMHYAIARGQNTRTLNPLSDVAGGRQVLRVRSFRNLGCGGPALLPAPLASFSAQYTKGVGVTMTWNTRDECFLSSFVVERSTGNDTTSWTRLGTVATRPPAAQYQFFDAETPGGLTYYRLRLVRPDGSLDNVAPALLTADATAAVFPNPVPGDQEILKLQYPSATEGVVTFRFYDALGRRIHVTSLNITAGLNLLPISVVGLKPGIYVLRWQNAQGQTGSCKFARL